ncbi:MAG: DUF5615 family PIN-like protein [Rhodothermales bacterium]|nr:DUF5615 family PIN-like protein [Rhodothermales bacterium]
MKLLFDQNLSPRLVGRLADVFPESEHVAYCGLDRATDREVWAYARQHGFAVVTKDADFGELGVLLGFPPKTVWVRRGNCSTADVERLLREHRAALGAFADDPEAGVFEIR